MSSAPVGAYSAPAAAATEDPVALFELLERLGEGSYGAVYKARDKRDGKTVAVKVVPVDNDISELVQEIRILEKCRNPHIVEYRGSFRREHEIWIVMEFCCAGSLSDLMHICTITLDEDQIAAVCRQVLSGLQYLHGQRHIHRDIKCGNILLDADGNAKLADFGVSVQLTSTVSKRKTVIGTPYWMAPEVLKETQYDAKADIWSLGITAYEMAVGLPPHSNVHPMRVIFIIPAKPPPTLPNPERWSNEFNDFIATCLVKDPERRPTAEQLAKHSFLRNAGGRAVLRELVLEQQHTIDEYREATMRNQEAPAASFVSTASFYDSSTAVARGTGTLVQHDGLGTVLLSDGTTVISDMATHDDIPAYMRQFHQKADTMKRYGNDFDGDSTMIVTKNGPAAKTLLSDVLDLADDDVSTPAEDASIEELRSALDAIDKAYQREQQALEQFYRKRKDRILVVLNSRLKQ